MPRSADAIRIRATARSEGLPETRNPREAFWIPLRESEGFSNLTIPQLEAKLCRQFGVELRSALLKQLSEVFRAFDSDLFPGTLHDFERLFFRYMDFPPGEAFRYQFAEAFTRFLEHRQELLRENAAFRSAQERIAAAAGVFFSTRISGYSSLGFDLSTGSFTQLAKAFDSNFDTFRVFLDAFVPVAFGEVFNQEFSDRFDFNVSIPASVEQAFGAAGQALAFTPSGSQLQGSPSVVAGSTPLSAARERAEWLWRLANGSLLIPLLLALVVMFYGMRLLTEIRNSQYDALQPILQHQLELLREDRLRMSNPSTPDAKSSPAATPAQPQTAKD